jgi:hypothetical protein
MEIREACMFNIHDGMQHWTGSLPRHHTDAKIKQFVHSIHLVQTDELIYRATHENKCIYYSILCSDQHHVTDHFQLGLYHQVKAWACLVLCNGPDKYHTFFQHLLTLQKLPTDVIVAKFIRYCNASVGGSVMSKGKGVHHRPHWLRPYLTAEMLYGLRVLLLILEEANAGVLVLITRAVHRCQTGLSTPNAVKCSTCFTSP